MCIDLLKDDQLSFSFSFKCIYYKYLPFSFRISKTRRYLYQHNWDWYRILLFHFGYDVSDYFFGHESPFVVIIIRLGLKFVKHPPPQKKREEIS